MNQPLSIAFRFLQPKGNYYLNFIACISSLGLVLAIIALVTVASVMNGFQDVFQNKLLGMVPHANIHYSQPVKNWEQTKNQLETDNLQVIAAAPYHSIRAMTSINGDMHTTIINGVIPKEQVKVSNIKDNMVQGSIDSLNQDGNIILGQTLVKKHGLKIGDRIHVLYVKPSNNSIGLTPKFLHFTLSAVFKSTDKIDEWFSFISLNDALKMEEKNRSNITSFRLKVEDVFTADKVVNEAAIKSLQGDFYANHWKKSHERIYNSIKRNKFIVLLLLFFIVLVSAFNIVSTLIMMITEKQSNIAILKTFGANKWFVFKIFLYQGIIITSIGIAIGLVLSFVLLLFIGDLSAWVNTSFNLNLFDSYIVNKLPTQIIWFDILVIIFITYVLSILATLYPAYKATQIIPAKILSE